MVQKITKALVWLTALLLAAAQSNVRFQAQQPSQTTVASQDTRVPQTFSVIIDISGSMDDKFPAPVQPVLSDSTKLMVVKRRLAALCELLPDKTRVLVTTFDHQASQLCDLVLNSPQDRERLRQILGSIKGRNGSTHLWRTADAELGRASAIARENTESRVRVLLYTDGDDMEKAPGLNHQTILQKYGEVLQSVVSLDWFTIGFDLQSEIKRDLEKHGVRVSKAETLEDLIPLRAGFRLSATSVPVGQAVSLIDDSLGPEIVERFIDWGDGSPEQNGTAEIHRYQQPGTYRVTYLVKTSQGKSSQSSGSIIVTAPPPPTAAFRIVETKVRPGEVLHLINESDESAGRYEWSANGEQFSTDRHPSLTIDRYGKYSLSLTVWDRFNQTNTIAHTLEVARPAAPVADFELPEIAQPEEEVLLVDKSRGELDGDGEWFVDNRPVGVGKALKFKAAAASEHVVRRVVHGPGGESSAERKVRVKAYAPPRSGFTIGNMHPFVGDVIRVTDISAGKIERSIFRISNCEEPIVIKSQADGERWFDLPCRCAGQITIQQKVVGPGGEAEAVDSVLVCSRAIQPKCDFVFEQTKGEGETLVRFINRSIGSAVRFEFDAGDGSPNQSSADGAFEHVYSAGRWVPTIKAYGPDGEGFVPSTWTSPTIDVAKPLAGWIKNLAWQIPVGLLSAFFVIVAAIKQRERSIVRQQLRLNGTLRVKPANRPREAKVFSFDGDDDHKVIELEGDRKLSIRSALEDGTVVYEVGLCHNGVVARPVGLEGNREAKLGDYLVSYSESDEKLV